MQSFSLKSEVIASSQTYLNFELRGGMPQLLHFYRIEIMPFDYDLLVIGAGSGGLAAAERAANYRARVAIVEQAEPGGACVNYGCIPEKLLDFAAGFHRLDQTASSYGWSDCNRQFDWSKFVTAKERHRQSLNQLHLDHLKRAGVDIFRGHAAFLDAHTVLVGDRPVTAEKILIAVGALAVKPDIPGIEHTINWHELYHLPAQPREIAIVGCDPIGVKIAGSLNALDTQVTQVFTEDRILPQLDGEMATRIQERMGKQGVRILNRTQLETVERVNDRVQLTVSGSHCESITAEAVLIDAPRKPHLENLQLNHLGVQLTTSGAIRVDAFSRTTQTNIFAVGDCTERIPLTPSAIAQARAFADTEFGEHPRIETLEWIPMSVASQPEAATIGYSEAQAGEKFGDAVRCYRSQFRPLLYSLAQSDDRTFVKLVVNQDDSERILGIHMVGDGAVEVIQSLAVALKLGATKRDLDGAIGIHPSSGEEIFSMRS